MMKIKNYEVVINEKNAQCGLVVNIEEYDISFLDNLTLTYKVETESKEIQIFNEKNEHVLTFYNIDDELTYYAFKTIDLAIMAGRTSPQLQVDLIFSANLQ